MMGVVGIAKVDVISHDHSVVLAASLMCSSLALSNAGVEMVDLPVACAVVCTKWHGALYCVVSMNFNSPNVENTILPIPAY